MHDEIKIASLFALNGAPTITETEEGGAGSVTFDPCACRVFVPGKQPISWLQNQKCADGAVLTTNIDGHEVAHLVELKSKLSAKTWQSVKEQLEGMLHNIHALCAVTGQAPPSQFRAYVAFKVDAISKDSTPAPALLKVPVGKPGKPAAPTADWHADEVTLLGICGIPLVKIKRDDLGDGQAKLIP